MNPQPPFRLVGTSSLDLSLLSAFMEEAQTAQAGIPLGERDIIAQCETDDVELGTLLFAASPDLQTIYGGCGITKHGIVYALYVKKAYRNCGLRSSLLKPLLIKYLHRGIHCHERFALDPSQRRRSFWHRLAKEVNDDHPGLGHGLDQDKSREALLRLERVYVLGNKKVHVLVTWEGGVRKWWVSKLPLAQLPEQARETLKQAYAAGIPIETSGWRYPHHERLWGEIDEALGLRADYATHFKGNSLYSHQLARLTFEDKWPEGIRKPWTEIDEKTIHSILSPQ